MIKDSWTINDDHNTSDINNKVSNSNH